MTELLSRDAVASPTLPPEPWAAPSADVGPAAPETWAAAAPMSAAPWDEEPYAPEKAGRPWLVVGLVLLAMASLIAILVALGSTAGAAGGCGGG